ncbi:hypothetical protein FO519_000596 [Halicephalobus sp. NKZ332]|nr:hypothetical protein FO519_000596 [Halicephalobus sp. NKZ332]
MATSPEPEETERNLRERLTAAQQLADRYENELSGERVFRKELEDRLRSLGSEMDKKVGRFQIEHQALADKLVAIQDKHKEVYEKMVSKYTNAASTFTRLEDDFIFMKKKYEKLLGMRKLKADELREQMIDLPQTVEELQFLCLQLREELIDDRAAKEHIMSEFRDELAITKEQLEEEGRDKKRIENSLTSQLNAVSEELGIARSQVNAMYVENKEMMERQKMQRSFQQRIEELESQVSALQKERQNLEKSLTESRQRCQTLQNELDTSETVQKDFVRLSQNLQIQLEKIRQAEQEVRWQFDDDIFNCNNCETEFGTKNQKHHCNHCGKIFCNACLSQTIPSGPQRRPAKINLDYRMFHLKMIFCPIENCDKDYLRRYV